MKILSITAEGKTYHINDGILMIIEHQAMGDGDRWYYDVIYKDKTVRFFDAKKVTYNNIYADKGI